MVHWPHWWGKVRRGLQTIAIAGLLWAGYWWTAQPVTLIINGQPHPLRLHRLNVTAALAEVGLTLEPEDLVFPSLEAKLAPGDSLTIHLARPVVIEADGRIYHHRTQQPLVAAVLAEVGLTAHPKDEIVSEGRVITPNASLPQQTDLLSPPTTLSGLVLQSRTLLLARPAPVHLVVHRAVPVTLHEGPVQYTFYTTQPNVGEALLGQRITLFLEDQVWPGLEMPLTPGMQIYLQRATPVTITVDGRTLTTRTRQETVGEVLAATGVLLMGQDFTRLPADQPLAANEVIEVIRVQETLEVAQEFIPFETTWLADETLELDQQEIRQPGITGVIKTRTRVRYENGQEVWREGEDKWLDQAARERVIAYGTKIVIRTLDTPDGPLEYWRKIPMLATAYNAANSGKAADHPHYGLTRSGLSAGYGVAAVDPKVVPLRTDLYIPDYGLAVAGDTGSRILGKHIDLGYDDDQPLPIIYEWRTVYVLTPVPPASRIRYVLPQWPQRE